VYLSPISNVDLHSKANHQRRPNTCLSCGGSKASDAKGTNNNIKLYIESHRLLCEKELKHIPLDTILHNFKK